MPSKLGDHDILLVTDVQNDFLPGGALAVPDGDAIVPIINRLARCFRHVALTQDWHVAGHSSFASSHPGKAPFETIELPYGPQVLWPDHCVQGTAGAQIAPALDIAYSAVDARRAGFEAVVIEDACRAIDTAGSLSAAWSRMRAAQVARVIAAQLT